MAEPTIGRIVIYRTRPGLDVPALITAIPGDADHPCPPADGHVHLTIFYPGRLAKDYIGDDGVRGPSRENGCWRWPERV